MAVAAVSNPQTDLVAALNGTSSKTSQTAVEEMSDRFLKLLVTQLKNQDPMNPLENAELTQQLAQMSTVEGINKLNDGLAALNSQFKASQVLQGAGLVGRSVLAEGDVLTLTSAGAVGAADLETAADSVKVSIFNADGALVQTLDLGKQDSGLARFAWDGKDSNGALQATGDYTFEITATAAGKDVTHTAYGLGQVVSVALNGDVMDVEVSGLGNRGLDQIKQIF